MRFCLVALVLFATSICHARLLQIIHTNDLHSYFPDHYNGIGGYARVLTKIKEIRESARAKGIDVLQLDAGDWGEGNTLFFSDNGIDSIKALEMLGTEVAAIGNHDHLLGGHVLGKQIREAKVRTKFVSANMVTTPDMGLEGRVLTHADLERGDIRIRVIGLSTPEPTFQYSLSPGKILSPMPLGELEAKKAKEEGRELVIALTHLGLWEDELLAKTSNSIDVIVGGHSHTKLHNAKVVKNLNGKNVPIVQAWAHGLGVGSLLLDLKAEGEVEVVDYQLHEIGSPLLEDPLMAEFVKQAVLKRNQSFDFNWDEVIGVSDVPLTGYRNGFPVLRSSCWGHHMATAARKAVNANVGIHIASFEGIYIPPGPITLGNIVENFPHIRQFGDQGWEIATVFMTGWKLKAFMYWISRNFQGITFSGLGYKNISEVNDDATYRIAFPAEVAKAIKTSFPEYKKYLKGLKYTGQFYWPVIMTYVKKNSPINCH